MTGSSLPRTPDGDSGAVVSDPAAYPNAGTDRACMFCVDAGMAFDWCRCCGRGLPAHGPGTGSKSMVDLMMERHGKTEPLR